MPVKKEELKKKLSNILLEKTVGAQIQSMVKYIEEGEKSTQYFLSLEKKDKQVIALKINKQ